MDFGTLASATGGGERQAALLLHSMAAADRDWVLQSLPAEQRDRVAGLVEELHALQITPDASLVHAAISAMPHSDPSPLPAPADADRAFLRQLAPPQIEALASLLQREPPRLAAQCLALEAWPWRGELLARLPARPRQDIGDHLLSPDIAPPADTPLARTLLKLMRAHGEAARWPVPAPRQGHGRPARLGWLTRWIGVRR